MTNKGKRLSLRIEVATLIGHLNAALNAGHENLDVSLWYNEKCEENDSAPVFSNNNRGLAAWINEKKEEKPPETQ